MSYPTPLVAGNQLTADEANDYTFNPVVTYGETIAARDALYLKASDSKVYKADADNLVHVLAFCGFAVVAGNADDTARIYGFGKVLTGHSGLTPGAIYYLSNTAGGISTSEGTFSLPVALALSATTLVVTVSPQDIARIMSQQSIGKKTSGEALAVGEACYTKAADDKLYRTDTDADESTYSFAGIVQSAATGADETVYYTKPGGVAKGLSGLTTGVFYFLTGAAGAIGAAAGARTARIGRAESATTLLVTMPYFFAVGTIALAGVANGSTAVVNVGFYPAKISFKYANTALSYDQSSGHSWGMSDEAGNLGFASSSAFPDRWSLTPGIAYYTRNSTEAWNGAVTARTATSFTLTNTRHAGSGTLTLNLQYIIESA